MKINTSVLLIAVSSLVLSVATAPITQGQTFSVIHDFSGGADGAYPFTGLTADGAGNFYGTSEENQHGMQRYGDIFKLTRSGSSWIVSTLYTFSGGSDGAYPESPVIVGPDGALYGTTTGGGVGGYCCGVIFKLTPPATPCHSVSCPWTETVLYRFTGGNDGSFPNGDLAFDGQGNLYGEANTNGIYDVGTVWELSRAGQFSVIYSFGATGGRDDGLFPLGGVTFGPDGSLYGVTQYGGFAQLGTVYRLTHSGSGWTEDKLYQFQNGPNGTFPSSGVVFDASGNLYGSTLKGGANNGGTLFELTPSQGSWSFTLLHTFTGYLGPQNATLSIDTAGNLFGTAWQDGPYFLGSLFEVTSQGQYVDLHDFTGGSDGSFPACRIALDANGNLYGTTNEGGSGYGVIFEATTH